MKKMVYTIHDLKAGTYHTPMIANTHAEALRKFSDLASSADSNLHRYPDDYRLLHIGWFDQESGDLEAAEPHTDLGQASQFFQPNPQIDIEDTIADAKKGK